MQAHKSLRFILFFLAIAGISACCKRKVYCQPEVMKVAFIGFNQSQVNNIRISQYDKDDANLVVDSVDYLLATTKPSVPNKPDTFYLTDYNGYQGRSLNIRQGNNWSIYLPATGRRYIIDAITDVGHTSEIVRCGDGDASCTNGIASFGINSNYRSGNTLWLSK